VSHEGLQDGTFLVPQFLPSALRTPLYDIPSLAGLFAYHEPVSLGDTG
jgi:hypothetical protein